MRNLRCVRNDRTVKLLFPKLGRQSSVASVATVSSLRAAFDRPRPVDSRATKVCGLFGVKELIKPEGFLTLKSNVLNVANKLVDDAIRATPAETVIDLFDTLSNELCKVADLAEFVRLAHPVEGFAKAAEATSFAIGGFVEQLNTHLELYKALKSAVDQNGSNLDPVTRKVGELFLFDFHQSGIHLDERKRKRAVELHEAVLVLGARFARGTVAPRLHPVKDWPSDISIPFQIKGDNMVVDSSYSESSSERMREHCYKAFMAPESSQLNLFEDLLTKRYQLARAVGFESFAHRTLNGTMGSNPKRVVSFLEQTLHMLKVPLRNELEKMAAHKSIELGDTVSAIMPWDIRYYMSLISAKAFNFSSKKLSEYFSLGCCMEGLNMIFSSLYGVSLKVEEADPGELWSPDVQKLRVEHETEGVLGHIYCDFYSRSGKLPQDSHFTIRGGRRLSDGTYQNPVVCLFCNFQKPSVEAPTLLSQGMVENLFHEMGHAMHSMLGRARYQHVTGTRCATDFAEVPSILMEYYAMDPRILPLYARHFKTGEALPRKIIDAMCASRKLFAASELQAQAFYAMVDQTFHGHHPLGKSTTDLLSDLHCDYGATPHVPGTAWHLRFGHFHSYAAKYYSYVWSKAVASRIWFDCFAKEPLSRQAGERYRRTMLSHGGGRPAQDLVEDMLGREVTVGDLVNSLEADLST